MNPGQQLHRSLTFWAGLLVILFTSWAWWGSLTRVCTLYAGHLIASTGTNGLHISWIADYSFGWGILRDHAPPSDANLKWQSDYFPPPALVHHQPHQHGVSLDPMDLKSAMQSNVNGFGPGSWSTFLPFWLILLTLIVTCSSLLLWRARRRHRAKLLQTS